MVLGQRHPVVHTQSSIHISIMAMEEAWSRVGSLLHINSVIDWCCTLDCLPFPVGDAHQTVIIWIITIKP